MPQQEGQTAKTKLIAQAEVDEQGRSGSGKTGDYKVADRKIRILEVPADYQIDQDGTPNHPDSACKTVALLRASEVIDALRPETAAILALVSSLKQIDPKVEARLRGAAVASGGKGSKSLLGAARNAPTSSTVRKSICLD